MLRCRCPCPCWPCWLAVYLSARRWRKVSNNILNCCKVLIKNLQKKIYNADLIIYTIYNYLPYYSYIPFRAVLAAGRAAGRAAGPLLVVSLVTGTAASLAASVGPSSVGPLVAVGRLVVASVRRGPSAVGRWSLVAVGWPVGQPCRVRYKYVRIGGGTESRKRAAVAGGGVPVSANTPLRCLIAKFFIFYFFLFFYLGIWRPVLDSWLVWRP